MLDLDAIERRANKATPGPWHEHDDPWNGKPLIYAGESYYESVGIIRMTTPDYGEEIGYECADEDVRFIVHAREDIPELIAEVRRLRAATNENLEK